MKIRGLICVLLLLCTVMQAHAVIYTGAMDNRPGLPFVPGITAQTRALLTGSDPRGGLRLEWQVDNETTPGSWTYTYRLLRGAEKNKGFAFFDIETASDFTAANILSRQVLSATDALGLPIPSGLSSVTISDPLNFNAVHDFSNPTLTETSAANALSKTDLSHYSGDPGRVAPGVPGSPASSTPSVGPVPHPFYGIRVTFPGSFLDLAYEASEWEFRIVTNRIPMWGDYFGWADQTVLTPFWYVNLYNDFIDSPDRLQLAPVSSLNGADPYRGWIMVPGPLPGITASIPAGDAVGVPVTEPVTATFSGIMDAVTMTAATFTLTTNEGQGSTPVNGTVSYDPESKTATFRPDLPLLSDTNYTATITSGARDLAGNPLALTSWRFTTQALDLSPPEVIALLPGNGSAYQPLTTTFTATFSEGMAPATLTPADFTVAGISGTVSYDPATRTAIFTPNVALGHNTTYTATLGTGITDLAGNPLAAPVAWDVTTIPAETVLPYVASTFPAARAVNVVTTTRISATFNEAIDPATLTNANFFVSGVPGSISYDAARLTATLTPAAPLAFNTSYALTVTTGVRDLAGNPVGLTKNFTLRTLSQSAVTRTASGTITGPSGVPMAGVTVLVTSTSQSGTAPQTVVTNASGQYTAAQLLNGTYLIIPSASGVVFSPPSIPTSVTTANVTALNFTGTPLISLSPDKPSPQLTNTPGGVTFTAAVPGGTGSYEFQFWLNGGTGWTLVQDYSATSSWNWVTSGAAPGAYGIQANVRSAGSGILPYEAATSLNYVITSAFATDVTLTANPASLPAAGPTVLVTAAGVGGTGSYEYQFWLNNGAGWTMVRDYQTTNSWNWDTAGLAPGTYTIQANVRNSGSPILPYEAAKSIEFIISPQAATGATLTSTPFGPQSAGPLVTFSAGGVGGSGSYEFQYWFNSGTGWTMVRDYQPTSSWDWNTAGLAAGSYAIQVNVRSAGSTALPYEVAKGLDFVINPPAATDATITANPASPQNAGPVVTFSAGGVGGTGSYEFQFWLNNGPGWTMVRDYLATNSWDWNTAGLSGTYTIQVNVRSAGSTALPYEAAKAYSFVVN